MKRKISSTMTLIAALLPLYLAPVFAHDEFRVIGTITVRKGENVEVKTKDGRIANIHLDKNTEIKRDDEKIAASELKVGQYVVVNAFADDYSDMLAMDIKIVPPPAK